jgi:glycosyltransferase involved in cell wall biosynthesis
VEQYVYQLTNALGRIGIEEHLVAGVEKNSSFENGVVIHKTPIIPFQFDSGFYAWALGFLVGGISVFASGVCALVKNRTRIKLVHAHDLLSAFLFVLAKRCIKLRTPVVFTVHGSTSRQSFYSGAKGVVVGIGRCLEFFVWKHSDFLVVLGNKAKLELVNDWGVNPEKVAVVKQGVDSTFFVPDIARLNSIRGNYNVPTNYCIFVGRLSPMKGPQYLLQAIRNLDISCLIVGDGPYLHQLEIMAKKLGISHRVTFTGLLPLSEVRDLYGGALFFVLPTLKEGSPLVILEAMSSSLPVISTAVSGIPDLVVNGHNGFIAPPADIDSLRNFIKTLADNPSLRKSMGLNARQTAIENDWREVALKYRDFYFSIIPGIAENRSLSDRSASKTQY